MKYQLGRGILCFVLSGVFFVLITFPIAGADGQIDILPDGNTSFVISKSGSYILVGNVTMKTDYSCISIRADNVTLDMNGHTLAGLAMVAGNWGIESVDISSGKTYDNITVTNGTVTNFSDGGLNLGHYARVSNVTTYANKGKGIECRNSSIVENCHSYKNFWHGIAVGKNSIVRNCTCRENDGGSYDDCFGISAEMRSVVENNICEENKNSGDKKCGGISITGGRVCGNVCSSNKTKGTGECYGIFAIASVIRGNYCEGNTSTEADYVFGIQANANSIVEGNTCIINYSESSIGTGIGINLLFNCRAVNNICDANGLDLQNQGGFGIRLAESQNYLTGNNCSTQLAGGNGKAIGIYVMGIENLVKANHATRNLGPAADGSYGIYIDAGDDCNNIIVGNTTSGNNTIGIKFTSTTKGGYASANLTGDGIDLNGANNKNGTSPAANDSF